MREYNTYNRTIDPETAGRGRADSTPDDNYNCGDAVASSITTGVGFRRGWGGGDGEPPETIHYACRCAGSFADTDGRKRALERARVSKSKRATASACGFTRLARQSRHDYTLLEKRHVPLYVCVGGAITALAAGSHRRPPHRFVCFLGGGGGRL